MPKTIPAINLVNVTKGDLQDISISRTDSGVTAIITYQVRDDQGNVHHTSAIHKLPIENQAALATWAEQFLPAINAQEGME